MDNTLNKKLITTDAIGGMLLGIFGAIPVINVLALFALFVLTGILTLRQYMVYTNQKLEMKETAILSAGGGFISSLCACIVFIPISLLFNVYGFSDLFDGVNLLVFIFLSFFFSLICAMTNAFVGSIFIYVYNTLKK